MPTGKTTKVPSLDRVQSVLISSTPLTKTFSIILFRGAPRNRIMENVFVRGVDEIRTDWTLSRDGTFVVLPVGTEEIKVSDLN